MALTFEKVINLTEASGNIPPKYVDMLSMAQEPNGRLWQYYLHNGKANDKWTDLEGGVYDESQEWDGTGKHMTSKPVTKVGSKQFPHIGAIGFYKETLTGRSRVLIPIHTESTALPPVTLAVSYTDEGMHVTLTDCDGLEVFRLIARSGEFSQEYIFYGTDVDLPLPAVTGLYYVTVIGYADEMTVCSIESASEQVRVNDGLPSWEPPSIVVHQALSELTDVNIVGAADLQLLQYKADQQRWANASIPVVKYITLLPLNWANNQQRMIIPGIIADESEQFIQVVPAIASQDAFIQYQIRCINQEENALVFSCATVPTENIHCYVNITEVHL